MAAALLRTYWRAQGLFSQKPHRRIHTTVWWDFDFCRIPKGFERNIAENIRKAVADLNYDGPVSIKAYHITLLSGGMKRVFRDTGVKPIRVWSDDQRGASAKMLMDMFFWAMANPPPANYLVISNDARLSYGLQELAGQHYNILLARDGRVPRRLLSPAKTLWRWKTLLRGGPPERSSAQNDPLAPSPTHWESGLGGLCCPQAPSCNDTP